MVVHGRLLTNINLEITYILEIRSLIKKADTYLAGHSQSRSRLPKGINIMDPGPAHMHYWKTNFILLCTRN